MIVGPTPWLASLLVASLFCSLGLAQPAEQKPDAPAFLRLMKMHQGSMAAEETCVIVYRDGRYRSESFVRRRTATVGFEEESLEVKDGKLKDDALSRLVSIVDSAQFRELTPPKLIRRIVEEDYDALQVAVFRGEAVQDLRYPTKASRKNSQQQLKPLLDWWQDLRKLPAQSIKNAQKTRCSP
jgi:hypothetical protein